jgi:hypothetical protein
VIAYPEGKDYQTLLEQGKALLGTFTRKTNPHRIIAIEEPFSVDLEDPVSGEIFPLPLQGVIDLVEATSARLEIEEALPVPLPAGPVNNIMPELPARNRSICSRGPGGKPRSSSDRPPVGLNRRRTIFSPNSVRSVERGSPPPWRRRS